MATQAPGAEVVRTELARVVDSQQFRNSPKLSRFLQLIIEESLAGRADQIKEYLIGVEVYNRPQDYDPRTDSTVRVEASKLRKRLDEYYAGAGQNDPVLITVPKGRYAPAIEYRRSEKLLRRLPGRWIAVVITFAFVLAGTTVLWTNLVNRPFRIANQRLVSTFPGSHSGAAFSPDSDMIAFVSKGEAAAAQVWLKNLSHDNPTRITEGEGDAARPRWSPRKDQIVFERTGRGIWSVSPLGGTARRIIEHGRNASFSPDGSHLVFERDREIWTARADGSSQQPLRGTPHRVYLTDASPTFSPDGHWIAFFHAEAGPKGDLWVIPARGGEPRRLTSDVTEGGAPVWTPDGRWIVFSSARAGSFTLWRVPFRGGRAEPMTTGAGEDREPAVSADGRRLIYTNVRNSWSLMLLDPASGRDKELFSRRENLGMPMFSPDGNRIAYFEHIGNDAHLFVVAVDGKDLTQLTHERSQQNIMPAWSQDGASLYFYRMRPSPSFRRLALGGASSIEVAPWVWGKQTAARVDPSGRAAVYTILEASRPAATVVRELSTGQERRLAQAISRPQWSPDSQFVVGSIKERQIMMCPASGESCTVVTAGNRPKWSRDGSQIYFFRATQYPDRFELWSAARDGSQERRISELGPFSQAQIHFDVSSQGHIVWAPYRQNRQELWLADLQ